MTATLHIETLGHLRIHLGDDKPIRFVSRRAELLLVYLAITNRPHTRDSLATLLWDDRDQKQSLANLRSLLTRLPKPVKPFLQIERHSLQIGEREEGKGESVVVDALQFEGAISQSADAVISPQLESALALYTGPFLAGVHVRDSFGLEEWMALQREKFGRIAATSRHTLTTTYLHQRNYMTGIPHARLLVESDPINEQYQRLLLRLLTKNGQLNDALKAYAACRQTLADELAITPSAETERLAQRIQAARDGIPHRVPQMTTVFVGRSAEIAALNRQLDRSDIRLVTLLGMGGIGKTRLALSVAGTRRNDYLDGIIFVSLAEQNADATVESIAAAIAQACVIPETPSDSISRLTAWLQPRELLLVLDNVEQCVSPCADVVAQLLQAAPKLNLLVTSRERLMLRDEWLHTIEGLPLPAAALTTGGSAATDLFMQRAMQLTASQHAPAAVARICRLVAGTPLAIELAAASVGTQSAESIAASIEKTYDALRMQYKDVPARHHSLRAAFEHSWQILTAQQQQLLSSLAIFVGSFDRDAAVGLSAHADQLDALERKSLLRLSADELFDLHPIVAEFAAEKVTDRVELVQAHRRYFADWLVERNAEMQDQRQADAITAVGNLFANCDAAWRSALDSADWESLAKMVVPFHHFHETVSQHRSGYERFAEVVGRLRPLLSDGAEIELLFGRILARFGYFAERIDRYDEANVALEESLIWLTRHEHDEDILFAMSHFGMIAYSTGDFASARSRYEQALAISRNLEQSHSIAYALSHLGYILTELGEREQALAALQESIALWREIGNQQSLAIALNGLASVYIELDRGAEALPYFEENIGICQALGDVMGQVQSYMNAGRCHLTLGNLAAAREATETALAVCEDEAQPPGMRARIEARLGDVYLASDEVEKATAMFDRCLQTCLKTSHQYGVTIANIGLAECAFRRGELNSAEITLASILQQQNSASLSPILLRALIIYAQVAHQKQHDTLAANALIFVQHSPLAEAQQANRASTLLSDLGYASMPQPTFEQLLSQIAALRSG